MADFIIAMAVVCILSVPFLLPPRLIEHLKEQNERKSNDA